MEIKKYILIIFLATVLVVSGKVWFESIEIQNSPSPSLEKRGVAEDLPLAESKPEVLPENVLLDVPFTAQAPLREWKDERQQDGCEEAALLMAAHWIRGEPFASAQAAKDEILALSKYQDDTIGYHEDTDAADTAKLFKDYFGHEASVSYDIDRADIKNELAAGNLVIVPVNGRKLGNPYFTPPGPERHNLLIIGYDDETDEFITNDAGIMRGAGYRYKQEIVEGALRDYPSGRHEPFIDMPTAMLAITSTFGL